MAYQTIPPSGGGGSGDLTSVASADASLLVTDGGGPDVDLSIIRAGLLADRTTFGNQITSGAGSGAVVIATIAIPSETTHNLFVNVCARELVSLFSNGINTSITVQNTGGTASIVGQLAFGGVNDGLITTYAYSVSGANLLLTATPISHAGATEYGVAWRSMGVT